MNKLLKKAKARKTATYRTILLGKDHVEVALAWAKGEIALAQVAAAFDLKVNAGNTVYIYLAKALKAYVQQQKA